MKRDQTECHIDGDTSQGKLFTLPVFGENYMKTIRKLWENYKKTSCVNRDQAECQIDGDTSQENDLLCQCLVPGDMTRKLFSV